MGSSSDTYSWLPASSSSSRVHTQKQGVCCVGCFLMHYNGALEHNAIQSWLIQLVACKHDVQVDMICCHARAWEMTTWRRLSCLLGCGRWSQAFAVLPAGKLW
jgi:hypothetical protein